jgi:2-polyprenyl-3-methyl-5-hydroxy-6-metoxy-1,4-benzoquinol methylase
MLLEAYFAPNDDAENDRLDMHHHLATLLIGGKVTTAPIGKNPQRILDVGCGTGIWSIDAGQLNQMSFKERISLTYFQVMSIPPPKS